MKIMIDCLFDLSFIEKECNEHDIKIAKQKFDKRTKVQIKKLAKRNSKRIKQIYRRKQ